MNTAQTRWSVGWLVAVLLMALGGCVATVGGPAFRYNANYYEPNGYDYLGMRSDYRVGPPPRGGYDHPTRSEQRPSSPAYRPAPPSRRMPSIPTHPRGEHPRGNDKDDGKGH